MFRRLVITFPVFGFATLQLPVAAFFICVALSLIRNFAEATHTHCRVYNFLPSLSAAVGGFEPQLWIWMYAIVVHTFPRIFVAFLYLQLNTRLLRSNPNANKDSLAAKNEAESCNPCACPSVRHSSNTTYGRSRLESYDPILCLEQISFLSFTAFICNLLELFALCGLSLVPSRENFDLHKQCFGFFVVFGFLYMLLTLLINVQRRYPIGYYDVLSYKLKKWTFAAYVSSFIAAGYFYARHNRDCEPYIYSYFALSEYAGVLTNVAFHATAIIDFRAKRLVLVDCSAPQPSHSRGDHWLVANNDFSRNSSRNNSTTSSSDRLPPDDIVGKNLNRTT